MVSTKRQVVTAVFAVFRGLVGALVIDGVGSDAAVPGRRGWISRFTTFEQWTQAAG